MKGGPAADSEDEGRGVSTGEATPEAGKGEERYLPRVSGEDRSPAHTLTLAQGAPTTVRQEIRAVSSLRW